MFTLVGAKGRDIVQRHQSFSVAAKHAQRLHDKLSFRHIVAAVISN